jgi:hypothetical protein
MNIHPDELARNGYIEIERLHIKELVPFIRRYIRKRTRFSVIYNLSNVICFALAGYFFAVGYNLPDYSLSVRFTHFCYGLALALALLPLHEYIHVLAYKSQGATNTSYAANLKKFYFMALADKFVANRKEFTIVALAPFVCISLLLLALMFILPSAFQIMAAAALLMHTAMCSGDFGLLSFFDFHRHQDIVTYDDVESGVSFFYGKPA